MKVLLTCGGTAGHVYPAVALARCILEHQPNADILFVGAEGGMETRLVPKEGFAIETVNVRNLRHKLTPAALAYNVKALAGLAGSLGQAKAILKKFSPDAVVGTGGYASFPAVYMASRMKIPTAIHESNATPGLTTRRLASRVSAVMVTFEGSARYFEKLNKNVVAVGTPVRPEFFASKKVTRDKPLVLSFWGSLGARDMNTQMLSYMAREDGTFRHVHATGRFAAEWMPQKLADMHIPTGKNLELYEFIYDMPQMMCQADLVICRAGASTIGELMASGTPAILVPSPNVTGNHQEKNAKVLSDAGAAILLRESECSGDRLYDHTVQLLKDKDTLRQMAKKMRMLAVPDATERMYQTMILAMRR